MERRLGLREKAGECSGGPLTHTGLCPQACGPTVHKACGENMYLKGTCLLLSSHLQIIRTVPAALPGRSPRDASSGWSMYWNHSCDQSMKLGSPPSRSLFSWASCAPGALPGGSASSTGAGGTVWPNRKCSHSGTP